MDAAARRAPPRRAEAGAPPAPLLAVAVDRGDRDAGPLVAHRAALRRRARAARARRAAARAAGDRHPRRRPRRGDPRRLRRRLRRAARARDARALPPRLLRRGARRRAVRARRRGRAAPRAARGRGGAGAARARGGRPGPAVRRGAAVAEAGRRARRARRRAHTSSCSAARRCSTSSAAAARSCRCAIPTKRGCGRRSRRSSRTCSGGGAKRLAVERFDGEPVAESEVMPLLVEAGFLAGPRRAVLRPSLGAVPAGDADAAPVRESIFRTNVTVRRPVADRRDRRRFGRRGDEPPAESRPTKTRPGGHHSSTRRSKREARTRRSPTVVIELALPASRRQGSTRVARRGRSARPSCDAASRAESAWIPRRRWDLDKAGRPSRRDWPRAEAKDGSAPPSVELEACADLETASELSRAVTIARRPRTSATKIRELNAANRRDETPVAASSRARPTRASSRSARPLRAR